MKIILALTLFLLLGCTRERMTACREMCPNGVKSYDDEKHICSCLTIEELKK